jgi:hypothetical protein
MPPCARSSLRCWSGLIFERLDLRSLVERGHTLPEMIADLQAVGKADGSGFGTAIWRKLGSSFELGDVVAAAGSGLNDRDIQSLATGVIRRDPAASVEWLIVNARRDPNHAIFNAVVREATIKCWNTRKLRRIVGELC